MATLLAAKPTVFSWVFFNF